MKVFKITAKNLKLLMRSKTSIFVVIFGPLIIMLLVGFAFNNTTASKLNIGYFANEKTNLTGEFLGALRTNQNFVVTEYSTEAICKDMIEQAKSHICIVFPKDFVIDDNKTNEIVFYVDQSRANFIYAVIDTVNSKISFTSNQLSYQMTNDLLSVIANTQKTNNQDVAGIITLKSNINDISTKLKDVETKLGKVNLTKSTISADTFSNQQTLIQTGVNSLKSKALDVADKGADFADEVNSKDGNASKITDFSTYIEDQRIAITNQSQKVTGLIGNMTTLIDDLSSQMDKINQKIDLAKNATGASAAQVATLQTSLNDAKTSLDELKSAIEKVNSQISALSVTSAESIVNPIRTTIKPISTKSSNLNFIFPYFIILIIVFISIMLSSNIIIMEKTSKAYFRNFTTPTKDFTFVLSVFLTAFIVVICQVVFILGLAYYFLNASILSNVSFTLGMILASITLFTLIGMIIGYMFNSQEAVTMAGISIGSVFLFLSNLILPIETMSAWVQQASRYNPYVMCSELLKKITLFGTRFKEVQSDMLVVGIYIVVALALAMIVQKISKFQYIGKKPITKIVRKEEIIDKYLKLKNGVLIRNENELLGELKRMSDIMFSEYVNKKKNDFESWLFNNKRSELAKKIGACSTRAETIEVLEKYLSKNKEK